MHSKILALAAGISLAFVSLGADAMPAGSAAGVQAPSNIQLAAEGCGVGFARGPAGGCRRIVRERVIVERPAVVVRRPVAPCGVRVGPVAVRTGC